MIHVIYIVDISRSMMGTKIESALETMREISNLSNICYSIITFANNARIMYEFKAFNYNLLNEIKDCKGLSNIREGFRLANNLLKKYKKPSILICLTDSLFTNDLSNLDIENSLLLEKIILSYNKTSLTQQYAKDCSVLFNDEDGLNEISKRIQIHCKSINENLNFKKKKINNNKHFGNSEEEDLTLYKDDSKWF